MEWAPTAKSSYLVAIQVEALDRNRLLSDITRALSDQHVNILSAAPEHQQGPDLPGQVHLRDRRPDASRPRAPGHPQRARRLRRLPHPNSLATTPEPPRHVRRLSWFESSAACWALVLSVVSGLELGWWDVAAVLVEAAVVVPVDPFGGGDLDVVDGRATVRAA